MGPNWPVGGEIDIVEGQLPGTTLSMPQMLIYHPAGVNGQGTNQFTLHTSDANCSMATSQGSDFVGNTLSKVCYSTPSADTGCGITDSDQRSFGKSLNAVNGGVFAHLWNSQGVKMWHFARGEVPKDITAGNPTPSGWGTPQGYVSSTHCDIAKNFYDHNIIINTDLCGGWATGVSATLVSVNAKPNDDGSQTYPSSCPGTCSGAVMNSNNWKEAMWKINYIAIYNGITGKTNNPRSVD